jgi:dipeptidyl aminopeptidase/acylaminoacyl peptidase
MEFLKRTLLCFLLLAGPAAAAESYSMATVTEEGKSVSAIDFSPDGKMIAIAIAEDEAALRVKEIAGGEGVLIKWQGRFAYLVAFSPDGKRLAAATIDFGLRIWDVASGSEIAALDLPKEQAFAIDLSPDGARIAVAFGDHAAHILDVASGRPLAVLTGHTEAVLGVAWSTDGSRMVTASKDGTARIWDVATAREIVRLQHEGAVNAAAWSFDGRKIVTGADGGKVTIFDAATGALERTISADDQEPILAVAFSRDGTRIASGSANRTARILNAASGETIAVLSGHIDAVYSVAFDPEGDRVLTAGRDATGRIWTRLKPGRMPDGLAGLWHQNLMAPEPMDDVLTRYMCLMNPFNVHEDGLIIAFMGDVENEPPLAALHLRCAADLSCQVFHGPPAQSVREPVDAATLKVEGDGAELCFTGECRVLARCPAIAWTEEEKASGYKDAWEERVMGE